MEIEVSQLSKDPSRSGPASWLQIEDVSAWILRAGLVASIAVMLTGIILSFTRGTVSIARMQTDGFDYRPAAVWAGIRHGRGKSIIEAGIYLLVLTPVMRVLGAMVLFALVEHDWIYCAVTLVVLVLTLAGLVWIH